ncbi:Histidine ammonia-lyase [BD1-7 clade bacterium]|uniref:tyrosine ammonia-lyase n=1 Tax=BD1-7 clade bacterium TaxID=2029982 RepID=A0A5S9QLB7_9GAMM|nr:Histidine ammonia-lyase [BD1-7 clade bacterium]CAA0119098.1 Histidine ammonia-lyase [BD1-7 clade bacterium]
MTRSTLTFDGTPLSIEHIQAISQQDIDVVLGDSPEFINKIDKGCAFLDTLLEEEGRIYGVTTGYGDSCTRSVPAELVEQLPKHLYTFHGCGLGDIFSEAETRAILAVRLNSLAQGVSGVRIELLQQLVTLIQEDILPIIPQEGSVGASGDLTPLSYIAAVLCGEREVMYQGQRQPTATVFSKLDIEPLTLRPKEGLAIMNGTAVMTALACLAFTRSQYLAKLSARITSLASIATDGNAYHFDARLFAVKPHPGQNQIAAWIHDDLNVGDAPRHSSRLQDRYSLRCAPHVIGVLQDTLPMFRQLIENELNSANDNPIIDGESEQVLHGGHFYGGHIAFAMDSMKNTVANLADLLDRQLAQLVDPKFNHGLPANLSGAEGDTLAINHGFKAVQIGASAWTAEALKHTMPASVFSRSTECHNQDKVSMGTIAARDCMRVLQLTEQVAAAMLLAATQGVHLRIRQNDIDGAELSSAVVATMNQVSEYFEFLEQDRALEHDLRDTVAKIQHQHWSLYDQ